eukprot:scaffold39973_cov30-Tisochrysis_lutea.AAC.6
MSLSSRVVMTALPGGLSSDGPTRDSGGGVPHRAAMTSWRSSPRGAAKSRLSLCRTGPPTVASISVEIASSLAEATTRRTTSLMTFPNAVSSTPSPWSSSAPLTAEGADRASERIGLKLRSPGVRRRLRCLARSPRTSRAHCAFSKSTAMGVLDATAVSTPMERRASAEALSKLSSTSTSSKTQPVAPGSNEAGQARSDVQLQLQESAGGGAGASAGETLGGGTSAMGGGSPSMVSTATSALARAAAAAFRAISSSITSLATRVASSSGVSGVTISRTVARAFRSPPWIAARTECKSTSEREARVIVSNPSKDRAVSRISAVPSRPSGMETSSGGGKGNESVPVAATTAAAAAAATVESPLAPEAAAATVVVPSTLASGSGTSNTKALEPFSAGSPSALRTIAARANRLAKAAFTRPLESVVLSHDRAEKGSSSASSGVGALHEKWRSRSGRSGKADGRRSSKLWRSASSVAKTGEQSSSTICVSSLVRVDAMICTKARNRLVNSFAKPSPSRSLRCRPWRVRAVPRRRCGCQEQLLVWYGARRGLSALLVPSAASPARLASR